MCSCMHWGYIISHNDSTMMEPGKFAISAASVRWHAAARPGPGAAVAAQVGCLSPPRQGLTLPSERSSTVLRPRGAWRLVSREIRASDSDSCHGTSSGTQPAAGWRARHRADTPGRWHFDRLSMRLDRAVTGSQSAGPDSLRRGQP